METIETDVVIVGGGPAGCSCALYTSRADLKTVILDKNPDVGALAITHQIANYPGVSSEMSGEALLKLMRDQALNMVLIIAELKFLELMLVVIGRSFTPRL